MNVRASEDLLQTSRRRTIRFFRSLQMVIVTVFVVALLGCTRFRAPLTCPKKGGPDWARISTPHFELHTDAGVEPAQEHARDLEVSLAALAQVLEVPKASLSTKLDVVWFNREMDYQALRGRYLTTDGLFKSTSILDPEPSPLMVEHRESLAGMRPTQHELVHRLLRLRTPSLPAWLDEGLAEYHSTLSIEDGHIVLGRQLPKTY